MVRRVARPLVCIPTYNEASNILALVEQVHAAAPEVDVLVIDDASPDGTGDGAGQPEIAALLRRAVEARRKLADVEDALARLAAGRFGCCEQCGSPIPAGLLTTAPQTRYCPRCDAPSAETGPDGIELSDLNGGVRRRDGQANDRRG